MIAAVNGPASVVVSGDEDAVIASSPTRWAARGVRRSGCGCQHAFHSPLMEPMLAEFAAVLEGCRFEAAADSGGVECDRWVG